MSRRHTAMLCAACPRRVRLSLGDRDRICPTCKGPVVGTARYAIVRTRNTLAGKPLVDGERVEILCGNAWVPGAVCLSTTLKIVADDGRDLTSYLLRRAP